MKKILLYIFFILLLPLLAFANPNWFQNANSDSNFQGGNAFVGFATNFNGISDPSFTSCTFAGSIYTPVSADFIVEGFPQHVTVQTTSIDIYSSDCELLYSISTGATVRTMPNLLNIDADSSPEIYFIVDDTLYSYEYQSDIDEFTEQFSINYSGEGDDYDYMTCLNKPEEEVCHAVKIGADDVLVFDLNAQSVSKNTAELTDDILVDFSDMQSGITNSRINSVDFRTLICLMRTGAAITCDILDETGSLVTTFNSENRNAWVSIEYIQAHYSKVGNVMRIFVSAVLENGVGTVVDFYNGAFSVDGTPLLELGVGMGADDSFLNWMIGDYDKDGDNDACLIQKNATDQVNLRCYNSIFNVLNSAVIDDSVINLTTGYRRGIIMADFNNSESTLGFATIEGVSYINGAFNTIYESGVSADSSRTGNFITVHGNLGLEPSAVYTDDTFGIIIKSSSTGVVCGDNICQGGENALTCPSDCSGNVTSGNITGNICLVDADCISGKCSGGICVLKLAGETCTNNDICLSGECNNGKCKSAGLWTVIETALKEMFGDDATTLFLIGLVLVLVLSAGLFIWSGSFILAGVGIAIGIIFLAFVGFIPAWLVIIAFVFGILALIVLFFLTHGGG